MAVMMAALLALQIAVSVWLRPQGGGRRGSESPLDALARRYARAGD